VEIVVQRFSAEKKAKRHPMAYLPFGAGPRMCIGVGFANVEVKLCLARLLAKYEILPYLEKFKVASSNQLSS
jgi:cytochrome P450